MRQEMSEDKFGEIQHIYKTDFVREVSDASKDVWVVAFLYKESYVFLLIFCLCPSPWNQVVGICFSCLKWNLQD